MKGVSVILPCLNEEQGIGICISKIVNVFENNCINGEIIIVDNGCTDKTIEIAQSFNLPNLKIVKQDKKGYGNAYLAGFEVAEGRIVVMGDADNSYDFYDIPRFLDALQYHDLVIGNRQFIMQGSMPFLHRYIGQPIFYFLMRNFFDLNISDSHCGFGAIKRDSLKKLELKSHGMEFASEILIKAKKIS